MWQRRSHYIPKHVRAQKLLQRPDSATCTFAALHVAQVMTIVMGILLNPC